MAVILHQLYEPLALCKNLQVAAALLRCSGSKISETVNQFSKDIKGVQVSNLEHARECYDIDVDYTTDGMIGGIKILDESLFKRIFGTTDLNNTQNPNREVQAVLAQIKAELKKDMDEQNNASEALQTAPETDVVVPIVEQFSVPTQSIEVLLEKLQVAENEVTKILSDLEAKRNEWIQLNQVAARLGWNV
jgi:hypothetical protein